jgi:hypothetical protein
MLLQEVQANGLMVVCAPLLLEMIDALIVAK